MCLLHHSKDHKTFETFRNKNKKKSKSQQIDPDSLAPPELELMEPGEATSMQSDAETSVMTEPEPLALQEMMDMSTDSAAGMSSVGMGEDNEEEQTSQEK